MFTGIIQEIGRIINITGAGGNRSMEVGSSIVCRGVVAGDSVSVDGACLTAKSAAGGVIFFDVMPETLRRTTLGSLKRGDSVNLEGALSAGGKLGGHFVLGHIDCVAEITEAGRRGEDFVIEIGIPPEFDCLGVEKGSVAIDGVSLTIGAAGRGRLEAYIIPHTLKSTTLGSKKRGGSVNVEFDMIAKHIAKMVKKDGAPRISERFLKEKGF